MLIQLQFQIIIKSKMSDKNNRKTLDLEKKMKVVNESKNNVSQRKDTI